MTVHLIGAGPGGLDAALFAAQPFWSKGLLPWVLSIEAERKRP